MENELPTFIWENGVSFASIQQSAWFAGQRSGGGDPRYVRDSALLTAY